MAALDFAARWGFGRPVEPVAEVGELGREKEPAERAGMASGIIAIIRAPRPQRPAIDTSARELRRPRLLPDARARERKGPAGSPVA